MHGDGEGRVTTDDFNARYYLEANPDVAASGMDPSVHYRRYGRFEGRRGWLDDDGLANRTLSQEFPNVDTRIHPKDDMFKLVAQNPNIRHPAALYLSTGLWVKECVLRALAEAEIDCQRLEHVLDFASGYGRVTRFWLQEFKAEQLWVSDVQHGAVDHLVETLGVHGIYASHDPASTQFPRLFDLVISISLFTHLPEQRTR